mmetsp:Transcript_11819/g.27813  ORF Transcript_11819/g.27813 Transcript_11819/m.27813 type:complete len:284 (-) Transcript_11819:73-924(-)
MRDDLISFGLGGNKVRKLDYLIADAKKQGATSLVVRSPSSFSRNAAAATRCHNLSLHVLSSTDKDHHNPASQAFFQSCGATLHYAQGQGPDLEASETRLAEELRGGGESVYRLHPGGSDGVGTLGYVAAARDIVEWSAETGVVFDVVVLATGSAATQAGLALGLSLASYPTRVLGMAISQPAEVQHRRVAALVEAAGELMHCPVDTSSCVFVDDRALGQGYPIPSPESETAAERLLVEEGVVVDTVYGGKAMAGLVDMIAKEQVPRGQRILFLHTGGNGGLYY